MPYDGLGRVISEDEHRIYQTWELEQEMDNQQAVFNPSQWPKTIAIRVDRKRFILNAAMMDEVVMAQYRDDEHKFFSHVGRVASLLAMGTMMDASQAVDRFVAFMGLDARMKAGASDAFEIMDWVQQAAQQLLSALPKGVWQALTPVLVQPHCVVYQGIWYGQRRP